MNIEAFNDLRQRGRIETEASAAESDQEVTLVSIAISLKRIADAFDGKPGTTGIHELLNAIEFNTREVL